MRYNEAKLVDKDWELLEVVKSGNRRPCSDEYENADEEDLLDIFSALRLLRAAGFPPDMEKGAPNTEKVGDCFPLGKKQGYAIVSVHVLKAKPSPWRLYFFVRKSEAHLIEFLYAVSKKKWKRDTSDLKKCCRILKDIYARRTESDEIDIPPR